jgi:hypothetical protein
VSLVDSQGSRHHCLKSGGHDLIEDTADHADEGAWPQGEGIYLAELDRV